MNWRYKDIAPVLKGHCLDSERCLAHGKGTD